MITLKSKHANIEKKQQILLEILGEKTEEVNDLTGDIQEMKRMYRQQTESLLEQIAAQAK
jgi:ribose 5-phosphate isomerase RpiB